MIILAPPAVLAYISQDALPTNKIRYPIKRKLEDGILFFAKFNPTTKALFAVTRSKRRFKESTALFTAATRDGKPLKELLTQTQEAFNDIRGVKDQNQRKDLIVKYNDLVKEYKVALAQEEKKLRSEDTGASNTLEEEETPIPTPTPTEKPTPTPVSTPKPTPTASTSTSSPQPLVVSCQADKTSIRVNQNITWTAKASGGTGSYTYFWAGTNDLKGDKNSVSWSYTIPGTKNATVTVKSGTQTVSNKVCTTTVTVLSLENLCPEPPKSAASSVWADYTKCIQDNFPEFDGTIDPGTATEFDLLGYGGLEVTTRPSGKSGGIAESPPTGVDVSSVIDAKVELVNINIDGIGIVIATNSAQLSKCTATKYRIALYKDSVNLKIDNSLHSVDSAYGAIQGFYNSQIFPLISSKKSKVKQFEDLLNLSATSQTTASESAKAFRNILNNFNCSTNPDIKDNQITNFADAINSLIGSFTNYKNALINLYDKVIEIGPTL